MASWIIKKYDGSIKVEEWTLPGTIPEDEITPILQRLVCTALTATEALDASRPRDDPERSVRLDRVGTESPLTYGENPFFTAELVG